MITSHTAFLHLINTDEELTGSEVNSTTKKLLKASLFGFDKASSGENGEGKKKGDKTLQQYLTAYYSLKREGNTTVLPAFHELLSIFSSCKYLIARFL